MQMLQVKERVFGVKKILTIEMLPFKPCVFSLHDMNAVMTNNDKSQEQNLYSRYLELFIVATLSVSMMAIFFNLPRWTRAFGESGFAALLLWAIYNKRKPVHSIPHFLIVMSVLYILSYVINVFKCPDPTWEHVNIRKYIYIIISGLLYAFPLKDTYRRFMIIVFFSSAAIAGAEGIFQYLSLKWGIGSRAQGFSGNPLHYAGLLAFVCSATIIMLFIREREMFGSKWGVLFLSAAGILTFMGILFSQARGVWVALIVAITVTLTIYDKRKALMFIIIIITALSFFFYFSSNLRDSALSVVTYGFTTDDVKGSAGNRTELWKGALLIFEEAPIFGVGTGNFEPHISKLIHENKLKEMPSLVHAHNIFFQALATRGIIGFITTTGLFISLILWGLGEIRGHCHVGGHIIILSTALTVIGGLSENNMEFTKFLASYCFTIGLLGSLGSIKNSKEIVELK